MKIFINNILDRLESIFAFETLGKALAEITANLIIGALVFSAFYLFWLLIYLIIRSIFKKGNINATTSAFVITATKYLILGIGAITALDSVGVNMTAMLTSLGIVGLTVGFAAKDALSNVISGVLIFLDRPFVIGDLVELEGIYGKVDRITLRSTRVVTSDGKMLAVPNTEIINKTVASYTNFPHLRLDIAVTVGVDEEIEKVRSVLLELVTGKDDFLADPGPRVVVKSINDYNIAIELQAWIKDERMHVQKRYELREGVLSRLKEAGISMPFETIALAPITINK